MKWIAAAVLAGALVIAGTLWWLDLSTDRSCQQWQTAANTWEAEHGAIRNAFIDENGISVGVEEMVYRMMTNDIGSPPRGCSP